VNGADVRVVRVTAADVRPLRGQVLRPGVPPATLVYAGDDAPDALHVAAFDGGRIVGIASLCREPVPGRPQASGWRLRGMATLPEARGAGIGARLLRECFRHVRDDGGGLLWCNARVVALGFYDRLGLAREGEEFDIPGIGPHYVMSRWLARLRPARADEAQALTDLALRSKAAWGYDADFLARCEPALRVRAVDLEAGVAAEIAAGARHHVVAEVGGARVGFHVVQAQDGDLLLDALFVEPAWLRRGIGRELFQQAMETAARVGANRLVTVADPHAVPFYERMGMRHDGSMASEIDGERRLPRLVRDVW
jgi:GNAT superfamily N-acetyltransferase